MKSTKVLRMLAGVTLLGLGGLGAVAAPDFSGTWALNAAKSQNLGMMSTMQITLKIEQNGNALKVIEVSKFNGQEQTRELHYDFTGKPTANQGPMGDANETITKWAGNTLETTWTQEGAVAGSKVSRTETRWLSNGGKTMSDQYVRGANTPMILVFEKQ